MENLNIPQALGADRAEGFATAENPALCVLGVRIHDGFPPAGVLLYEGFLRGQYREVWTLVEYTVRLHVGVLQERAPRDATREFRLQRQLLQRAYPSPPNASRVSLLRLILSIRVLLGLGFRNLRVLCAHCTGLLTRCSPKSRIRG